MPSDPDADRLPGRRPLGTGWVGRGLALALGLAVLAAAATEGLVLLGSDPEPPHEPAEGLEGRERWRLRVPVPDGVERVLARVVTVADGSVYVLAGDPTEGGDRSLSRVDADTGAPVWSAEVALRTRRGGGEVVIIGELVVVASELDGRLDVLRVVDGRSVWSRPGVDEAVVVGSTVVVVDQDGIRGLDLTTGVERWSHADLTHPLGPPGGGLVAWETRRPEVAVGLDPATGRRRWTTALDAAARPLLEDAAHEALRVGAVPGSLPVPVDGRLVSFDLDDGTVTDLGVAARAGAATYAGSVVVYCSPGLGGVEVHAVDVGPPEPALRWTRRLEAPSTVALELVGTSTTQVVLGGGGRSCARSDSTPSDRLVLVDLVDGRVTRDLERPGAMLSTDPFRREPLRWVVATSGRPPVDGIDPVDVVDARSGVTVWTRDLTVGPLVGVFGPDLVRLADEGEAVIGFGRDGDEAWRVELGGPFAGFDHVDGVLYLFTEPDTLLAVG